MTLGTPGGAERCAADATSGVERRRRSERESWLLFVLALVARLVVVAWAAGRFPPTADGTFYQTVAERIAAGHGYTWLWPDGAVTYAAHYPVGYPAMLGLLYALTTPTPTVAMLAHAVLGALTAFAVHRLLARHGRRALFGGLAVALHPGLVAYTPALMTEGVVSALLVLATLAASAARRPHAARRGWPRAVLLTSPGLLLGVATLVRPQVVLLAPFLGVAASRGGWARRLGVAVLTTVLAVGVCMPWTVRNCTRMGRCAFVSVNGGWNLLIGTDPGAHGGWAPLAVPESCREVFDEAGKDRCFGEAARSRIAEAPWSWLSLVPGKWRATLDYCGAAGWYLHQSNPQAFGPGAKMALGVLETVVERLVLVGALFAVMPSPRGQRARERRHARPEGSSAEATGSAWARLFGWVGVAAALSPWGWLAHLVVTLQLARAWWRTRLEPLRAMAFAALGSTFLVHGVFFGGGRYQLPLLAPLAAIAALARLPRRRGECRPREEETSAALVAPRPG